MSNHIAQASAYLELADSIADTSLESASRLATLALAHTELARFLGPSAGRSTATDERRQAARRRRLERAISDNLPNARVIHERHWDDEGRPVSADILRRHLKIGKEQANALVRLLRLTDVRAV